MVFTKEPHHYNTYNVHFDIILEFDKNGRLLQRYSFWDHLKEYQPYHAKFEIDASPCVLLSCSHGKRIEVLMIISTLTAFFWSRPIRLKTKIRHFGLAIGLSACCTEAWYSSLIKTQKNPMAHGG